MHAWCKAWSRSQSMVQGMVFGLRYGPSMVLVKDQKKEGDEVEDPRHKHPCDRKVCSLTWEPKGKSKKGKIRENSYEAMSLVLTSVNGKINSNIKGANGPTQVTNSWKVRISPEEGIGRGSRGKPGGMRAKTCLNLRTRSRPHPSLKESTSSFFLNESECRPLSRHMMERIKKLNENIPKTVDEMMIVTKAFIRGEKSAANQSKRRSQPWKQPDFQKSHPEQGFERKEDFKRRPMDRKGDRFMPLTKTPKEILAMEVGKGTFTTPPPDVEGTGVKKKNYCDFHRDKGHNTDDYLHLKRQIEEAVKSGQLTHLVNEIKQGSNKASTSKSAKKT
ncbi:hypothetical protein Tco_0837081 [Tanacetum coccineum]